MSASDVNPAEPQSPQELRELAESAARVGGELARASLGQPQVVSLKADRSEVTEVDVAAERAIIAHIRSQRPDDAFIGEEAVGQRHEGKKARRHEGTKARRQEGKRPAGFSRDKGRPRDAENSQSPIPSPQSPIPNPQSICWVVDPLDGTRNYVRNLPIFTCAVAAMRDGKPIAGAIFDPIQNVMYSAALGHGLYVDGRRAAPMQGAQRHDDERKDTLLVGIPSTLRPSIRKLVLHAVRQHVVRNLGSTALHLALVATGPLDAAVLGNSKLWDIAAGALIVAEAGGLVTTPAGGAVFPIDLRRYAGEEIAALAGRPEAHARLMREARRR
jgi:fructose-1,6-bisphosphatase/inositol monophosphatase family enzyme